MENATTRSIDQLPTSRDDAADAIWIMTSTFTIFTMQSGFGLLESGIVSTKNEINIMVKNAIDVITGGISYWCVGYALSFGSNKEYSNAFCGWGNFFLITPKEDEGTIFAKFFFQASFTTTATTIVSGAMAERMKLESYIIFSVINTLLYCIPAHWVFDERGWLNQLGMVDIAGDGPVHLVGGVTGLVATYLLGPRHNRFNSDGPPQMGCPTNAILGMFMLWWGWLAFNCGSTFGVSGYKWQLAARSAVNTINAVTGGGIMSIIINYVYGKRRRFDISFLINGILGSLVAITAFCALARPFESVLIGAIGSFFTIISVPLINMMRLDDPVSCIAVHAVSAVWGLIAVGLFAREDNLREVIGIGHSHQGLIYGGGWYLLGVQTLGIVAITAWTLVTSYLSLKAIDMTIGLRVSHKEEMLGADQATHGLSVSMRSSLVQSEMADTSAD